MPHRVIAFLAALWAVAAGAQETLPEPSPVTTPMTTPATTPATTPGATAAPSPMDGGNAAAELAAMRAAVARGEVKSLSEIMPAVMAVRPGKIIEIHFQQRDAGPVYVVYDLTPDWQLFVLTIDARTGEVLSGPAQPAPPKKDQS